MSPGPILLVGAVGMVGAILIGRAAPRLWLATNLIGVAALFAAATSVLAGGAEWEWLSRFTVGGEPVHLRLDNISAVFLALLAVVAGAGAVYAQEYWADVSHPQSARSGRMWWSTMVASIGVVLLSSNGLHFLIAWELFAVASYFLLTLDRQRSEVRAAGWLYLAASHVATLCLFAYFAILAAHTGSWELGPMREHTELAPLFWLALAAFGLKAGLFPLHIWLPSAHANAPSHVSAIMSGVLLKTGVYGLVRVTALLPHPPAWWGCTLLVAGTLSAILGIAFAMGQRDLKRLLAYSSIENVGIITMGIGLAAIGRSLDRADWIVLGLGGALLHVLNHSLFKPLMFFGAGGVVHAAHTRQMDLMGGLGKLMPKTFTLVVVGAVALCGLPPLNGFVGELLIYLGLFRTMDGGPLQYQWGAVAAPALALVGAIAVATFVKMLGTVFAGVARTETASHGHDPGPAMLAPMGVLATCCLLIGVWPACTFGLLNDAVRQWAPGHIGGAGLQDYVALGWFSALGMSLIAMCVAGWAWLSRPRRVARARWGPTWDCGYARPTARMQYTGSSSSQMLVDLLAWVLWPRKHMPRLRGALPAAQAFSSEVPDVVLDRTLLPALGAADRAFARARVIQRGTVQVYLLYVLGILILLLILG